MKHILENDSGIPSSYLGYPLSQEIKINGYGAQGHVHKSRNHEVSVQIEAE